MGILPEAPTAIEEDATRTGTGDGCIAGGSVEYNFKMLLFEICDLLWCPLYGVRSVLP